MDISKVLDDAKATLNVDTDYKLAKRLEISNGYIAQWRKGTRIPDAYACAWLAEILGIDPFELLAQVEAATEKNEARRTYWRAVAAKMAAGTVAGFFVIALPGATGLCDIQNPVIFRSRNTRSEKLLLVCLAVVKQFRNWYAQCARQAHHSESRHAPGLIHVAA